MTKATFLLVSSLLLATFAPKILAETYIYHGKLDINQRSYKLRLTVETSSLDKSVFTEEVSTHFFDNGDRGDSLPATEIHCSSYVNFRIATVRSTVIDDKGQEFRADFPFFWRC